MGIVGDWDVRIKTPIGSLHTVYRFVEHEGQVCATATGTWP